MKQKEEIKKAVSSAYGQIAANSNKSQGSCCGGGCCDNSDINKEFTKSLGYTDRDVTIASDANLGLGCGNPLVIASIKEGDIVLDLGSGAGFDCFLAVPKVGSKGKVIGVDMTPQMIEKARSIANNKGINNIEFRLGEIENLPVENDSIDLIISNCVVNLSTDKEQVFKEAYRVLKGNGRISISDMALLKDLPLQVQNNMNAYSACISGALKIEDYKSIVEEAGFKNVKVTVKGYSTCIAPGTTDPIGQEILSSFDLNDTLENYAVSIIVEGSK